MSEVQKLSLESFFDDEKDESEQSKNDEKKSDYDKGNFQFVS